VVQGEVIDADYSAPAQLRDRHPPRGSNRSANHAEYRLMSAYNRSFTNAAILTLVLYFVLWIPGLIANVVYLLESMKVQRITGESPEGQGCLVAMLAFLGGGFLLGCGFWFFVVVGAASS
jgi:hypothetical protein